MVNPIRTFKCFEYLNKKLKLLTIEYKSMKYTHRGRGYGAAAVLLVVFSENRDNRVNSSEITLWIFVFIAEVSDAICVFIGVFPLIVFLLFIFSSLLEHKSSSALAGWLYLFCSLQWGHKAESCPCVQTMCRQHQRLFFHLQLTGSTQS